MAVSRRGEDVEEKRKDGGDPEGKHGIFGCLVETCSIRWLGIRYAVIMDGRTLGQLDLFV